MTIRTKNTTLCAHCSLPAQAPVVWQDGATRLCFCCGGCRSVYLLTRLLRGETA
jgi:endogenous inhibitor of DNA gyrase (YacG/DUF329 family)